MGRKTTQKKNILPVDYMRCTRGILSLSVGVGVISLFFSILALVFMDIRCPPNTSSRKFLPILWVKLTIQPNCNFTIEIIC
jgi:hypothetical protein